MQVVSWTSDQPSWLEQMKSSSSVACQQERPAPMLHWCKGSGHLCLLSCRAKESGTSVPVPAVSHLVAAPHRPLVALGVCQLGRPGYEASTRGP